MENESPLVVEWNKLIYLLPSWTLKKSFGLKVSGNTGFIFTAQRYNNKYNIYLGT